MSKGRLRIWGATICTGFLLFSLTGCTNFFACENKAACPASTSGTGGGSSSSVDLAYVAYTSTAGVSYLVGYNIASGALTQVSSVTLPYIPAAIAVSPSNGFLYVASVPGATSPGIYGYSIATDGSLTALKSGAVLNTDTVAAMTISPDGNYLYTVSALGLTMAQYTFASDGTVASAGAVGVSSANCALGAATPVSQTCSVAVSPSKTYVVGSFGTAGSEVLPYTSSGGLSGTGAYRVAAAAATSGDFSVAIDGSDNAYVAQTAGLTVYQLGSGAVTNRGTVTYASGVVPRSVTIDPDSKFVFTANEGNGTISAFTTGTTTALSAVAGSPFAAPAHVAALGADSTDAYLVAAGYDASAGVKLYSVSSAGVLAPVASAATSTATQYPVLVAMSH